MVDGLGVLVLAGLALGALSAEGALGSIAAGEELLDLFEVDGVRVFELSRDAGLRTAFVDDDFGLVRGEAYLVVSFGDEEVVEFDDVERGDLALEVLFEVLVVLLGVAVVVIVQKDLLAGGGGPLGGSISFDFLHNYCPIYPIKLNLQAAWDYFPVEAMINSPRGPTQFLLFSHDENNQNIIPYE